MLKKVLLTRNSSFSQDSKSDKILYYRPGLPKYKSKIFLLHFLGRSNIDLKIMLHAISKYLKVNYIKIVRRGSGICILIQGRR